MQNIKDFNETLYSHYIGLFHETNLFETRMYARRKSNYYGRLLGYSEKELRDAKAPIINLNELLKNI